MNNPNEIGIEIMMEKSWLSDTKESTFTVCPLLKQCVFGVLDLN